MGRRRVGLLVAIACCALGWPLRGSAQTCTQAWDDSALKVVNTTSVTSIRQSLIQAIWGSTSIPTPGLPTVVKDANTTNKGQIMDSNVLGEMNALVGELPANVRVDMLQYPVLESGSLVHTALAWHIIPPNGPLKKNKIVIVHQGHNNTLVDPAPANQDGHYGLARLMNALLQDGYSVLGMYMPRCRPSASTTLPLETDCYHEPLFDTRQTPIVEGGSGMKFFMTPINAFLNYVKTQSSTGGFTAYTNFYMAGLSGGGWSTTVYSAIDPTIEYSFPVAGGVPFFMRCQPTDGSGSNGSDGDYEETYPPFYSVAGYPDLYLLGSYGTGPNGVPRHQTQVLNRNDDGAYGQAQYRLAQPPYPAWDVAINGYETNIRNRLFQLGQGMFRSEIDENTTSASTTGPLFHMVSMGTTYRTILGELNGARRMIGRQTGSTTNPSNNDAFYRGINGHLFHYSIATNQEEDTGIPIVGVPDAAWVSGQSSQQTFNVIARNIHGSPILMSTAAALGGWSTQTYDGLINNDPTIISGKGSGQLWTFAFGTDYLPYVWDSSGHHQQISSTVPGLGPISASVRGFNQGFHVFYMTWNRSIQHYYRSSTSDSWHAESVDAGAIGFPTGTVASNGDLILFDIGTDGQLYWKKKPAGDQTPTNSWTGWNSISSSAGMSTTVVTGTPAFWGDATSSSQNWSVFVPLPSRNLAVFKFNAATSSWSFTNLGGLFVGPATSHQTGAYIRGRATGLWSWTGSGSPFLVGGHFD